MTSPDTAGRVLEALDTTEWRSPRQVADKIGAGYSTVTAVLRDLETSNDAIRGHVTNTGEFVQGAKTGRPTVWRKPVVVDVLATAAEITDAAGHVGHPPTWPGLVDDAREVSTAPIDTTRQGEAVDLSGDGLDLAAAGIDVTAGRAESLAAHDAAWAAGTLRPVDDLDAADVSPVSVAVETAATMGGAADPVVPGTPVVDDQTAPVLDAPADATPWHDMRTPAEAEAVTVDLTPATAEFSAATAVDDPYDQDTHAPDGTPVGTVDVSEWREMGYTTDVPAAFDNRPVSAPPAGSGLGAVLDFMTAVRPISAPPADAPETAPRQTRSRNADGAAGRTGESDRRNDWGRGELAAAALAYVVAAGHPVKPGEVAKAINGFSGSVDFALKQYAKKGTLVRITGDGPARYALPEK